jgi:hypothetical protein
MIEPKASFNGYLNRRPFSNKASSANMQVLPLLTLSDLEVMSNLPSHDVPVLINVAEHYRFLAKLVGKASEVKSDLNILIRFSMPGGTQIDPALLSDNVLILQDLESEEKKLSQLDKALLVIDDNFAHFEVDNGDNLISLRLYDNKCSSENTYTPLIEQLTDLLAELGVSSV